MLPKTAQTINVHLPEAYVGSLTWLPTQKIVFSFSPDYVENHTRPTLSLSFGVPGKSLRANGSSSNIRLPPFFSNLLPEGKLKDYLAKKADVNLSQEFFLLAALREDLPGAVTLGIEGMRVAPGYAENQLDENAPLSFSLAGVQLKLSGNLANQKIVIPSTGAGGHWIVKLPVPGLPRINELEHAMLTLGAKIGIETPEVRLVPSYDLENLPKDLPQSLEGDCLLSRRFDRTTFGAQRIHAEDFCQVFGVYDKYDTQYNYQTIASVIWSQIGLSAIEEFIRRLVFSVAIGNADMHLKNWSLLYSNQRKPQLSPAYDFVPSAAIYPHTLQRLCLKIAGEWDFRLISIEHFKKLAALAKLPENIVIETANHTADLIHKAWRESSNDLGLTRSERRSISEQINKSSLLNDRRTVGVVLEPYSVAVAAKPSAVHFGLVGEVELDEDLSLDDIVYRAPAGDSFRTSAPSRMNTRLIMDQLHEIVRGNPQLNDVMFTAIVGLPRFLEWREENIIRIEARTLKNKLTASQLTENRLDLDGIFFGNTFAALNTMWNLHRHNAVDFEFADGELWSANCSVQDISDISVLPDGRRICAITLSPQSARQILKQKKN